MSKVLVTESHLGDIADAIRAKNGSADTYRPGDMAAAIAAIPSGGITPAGTISITQNGTVDVTNYASASVNVSGGGGSVAAFIRAIYAVGGTVSCSNGTTTLTGDTSGDYTFAVPSAGTWTISSGGRSQTITASNGGKYLCVLCLPYSSATLAVATVGNFDAELSDWGGLTKSTLSKYKAEVDHVRNEADSVSYATSGQSVTAYYILQSLTGDLARQIAIYTSETDPGKPCFFQYSGSTYAYDRGNVNFSVPLNHYYLLTLSWDRDTGTVKWYINGTLKRTATGYTTVLSYVYFNGTSTQLKTTENAYLMAVAQGAESDQTVQANCAALMGVYGISA